MRRGVAVLFGLAVLSLGVTACGGGGGGRYEESGFVTFKIPGGFHIDHTTRTARSAGGAADQATLATAPNTLIIVQRYNLPQNITSENLGNFKGTSTA